MNNSGGSALQKTLLKIFPDKVVADIACIILLLLFGMLAITLHAKLRIPLQLPGRQGIIFVSFIMVAKTFSGLDRKSVV